MRLTAARAAAAAALAIAVGGVLWFTLFRETPPACPGDSAYCDRAAYIAAAAASCAANAAPTERRLIEETIPIDAYCACMAGRMADAFDPAALWRIDRGEASAAERGILQTQRETWAAACLKP